MHFIELTTTEDRAVSLDVLKIAAIVAYKSGTRVSFDNGWTLEVRESASAIVSYIKDYLENGDDELTFGKGAITTIPAAVEPDSYFASERGKAVIAQALEDQVARLQATAEEDAFEVLGADEVKALIDPLTKRIADLEELLMLLNKTETVTTPAAPAEPAVTAPAAPATETTKKTPKA